MKRKAVIVSLDERVSLYLKGQLDQLLGSVIDFDAYSLDVGINGKIACDLCIFPTEDSLNLNVIAEKMLPGTQFLSVRRTLQKGQMDKLAALPYGTRALLVNTSEKLALEAISFLLELGANHITFFPCYPGAQPQPPDITLAVTPDEEDCVPPGIRQVVNIGPRVIDSSTIFEIVNMLKVVTQFTRDKLLGYMSTVMPRNIGFLNYINQLVPEADFLREIAYVSSYVVIATDDQGQIIYNSRPDRNIANRDLYGKKISECFRSDLFQRSGGFRNELLEIDGKSYLMNKMEIYSQSAVKFIIYALIDVADLEAQVYSIQRSKVRSQNKAKYTFKDIIGSSESIARARSLALKAAGTELDILIEAETGSGKELFANSIHNASRRRDGPFIAFNCAALSSGLLESELFGYEEGAFTGAKKGGRHGLIESANNGTLFLDEIGEIAPAIQVKLLRVLQEREVIRVGGTSSIPINIRVIAATNQNLNRLVEAGAFRKDLFYRLSVLPIRIPPLRERPEDIVLLLGAIFKNRDIKMDIPETVISALTRYDWPGNVRELINCCEYIINMEERFTIEALPYYIRERILSQAGPAAALACAPAAAMNAATADVPVAAPASGSKGQPDATGSSSQPKALEPGARDSGGSGQGEASGVAPAAGGSGQGEASAVEPVIPRRVRQKQAILAFIDAQNQNGRHVGRKSIAEALTAAGILVTEGEVRNRLGELDREGLVEIQKGRSGTHITQKGLCFLHPGS